MDIQSWLDYFSPTFYWVLIFLSAFVENIFPPYPGDTVIVLGGYLAGLGKISFIELFVSVFAGSVSGAVVMYFLGQNVISFFAKTFKSKAMKNLLREENIEKTKKWFEKYGFVTIVFSRFSAGIRFFVSIAAGLIRMNFILFLVAFIFATILWNGLLILGGYTLGNHWSRIVDYIKVYNSVVIAVILTGLLSFFIYKKWGKSGNSRFDEGKS